MLQMARRVRRILSILLHLALVLAVVIPAALPLAQPAPVLAAPPGRAAVAAVDGDEDVVTAESDAAGPIQASSAPAAAETSPDATPTTPPANPLAAYLKTVDLGGGERAAVISADPVNYLAADGEWRPIEPRFAPAVDGFANRTNLLELHAAARRPVLEVIHSDLAARWTPQTLLLAQGTREVILARPQPVAQSTGGTLAADGRTITYAGSWSDPALSDEIIAGPGQAEHNVIFDSLPGRGDLPPAPGDRLVLRARLELPPGGQLFAGGVLQTGAFTTTGTLELRDATGATRLQMLPATVHERGRPDQAITATYVVTPVDQRGWQVSMETPWTWWADPARQFPVVWDPLMQVLRAVDVAQIYDNPNCQLYLSQAPDTAGVGRAPCIITSFVTAGESRVRTLLRFNQITQLNLPPGAQIRGAILLAAPTDGYVFFSPTGQYNPCVNTQLHRVTGGWDPNGVTWGNQPGVDGSPFRSSSTSYAGRTDPPLCYDPPPYDYGTKSGTKWILQDGPNGLVSDWLNGAANNGLELRARPDQENGCDRFGCDFVRLPKRGVWSPSDRNLNFDNDFEAPQQGGFMLIIRYQGPALTNNTPYKYDNPVPKPPKLADEDFHRTRHVYTLPAGSGRPWLAVAAKGFRTSVVWDGLVKQGQFSYAFWSQTIDGAAQTGAQPVAAAAPDAANAPNLSAFAFPLAVANGNCTSASCESRSEGGGSADGSNFILVSAAAAAGKEVRIDPLPADPKLGQYAVEASWSTALPPINPSEVVSTGVRYQYTLTVDSGQIVQTYDLSIPDNVRLSIGTETTIAGLNDPSAWAVTHLFPPGNGIYPKSLRHDTARDFQPIRTFVPPGKGGTYGLVLELPGDKTAFDICDGDACGDEPDRTPRDRTLQVVLTIQVCPSNGIPTNTGCALVVKPEGKPEEAVLWRDIGPYSIFSPAGFETCGTSAICSKRYVNPSKKPEYATLVTWGRTLARAVITTGDGDSPYSVSFSPAGFPPYLSVIGIVALGKDPPTAAYDPIFELTDAGFLTGGFTGDNYGYLTGGSCFGHTCRGLALSDYDLTNYAERYGSPLNTLATWRINVAQNAGDTISQYAEYTAPIARPLRTVNGTENQLLRLTWRVQAEGYRGWLDSPNGTGPLNVSVAALNSVGPLPVASLTYAFTGSWDAYYDPAIGYFTQVRNDNGRIVQKADLGGAWQVVDLVVLPFGEAPGGGSGLATCPAFCGDVRAPDDTWASPNRQWKMPDVLVNQLPNTVMVSSPGSLSVYSTDHPTSLNQTNDTYGFSFKTFGARVELVTDACPGGASNQPVPLIRGTTSISLPGLDAKADPSAANSAIPSITAKFVLCEDALRQVSLTFSYPPGIPVAQPPVLFVDLIGGTVTIGPSNVVIQLQIGFYIGTGVPKIFKGAATVTIDTRGLFDMQATGRIMGMMDGEGHLWVAWNPLDMGIGSRGWLPNKNDWVVSGFIYAHVWRGSGWQNRYPWLAGNDDFHLTASYQAEFRIKEGAVVDEWPLVIPPGDISIKVELSFGQFCANDNCTDYEWGIKGKVEIIGFDVGIYVSLECPALLAAAVLPPAVLLCTSFILGSDDHLLIDQYGPGGPPFPLQSAGLEGLEDEEPVTPAQVDESLAQLKRETVADPSTPEVDRKLTVKPSAASILVAFGWVRGAPRFALITPNGQTITAANAAGFGVTVSTTANSQIFGIDNPADGDWTARITNVKTTDDWHIQYYANKATPGLTFTAPAVDENITATGNGTTSQLYTIRWNPPPNAAQLRMTLFYSATVPNATSPGYLYGGVIRENINPSDGAFGWDLSHLASGDYKIYATLEDNRGSRVTRLGQNQYVGVTTSIAPGVIHYEDKNAPPLLDPGSVTYTPVDDGMLMCWGVSPAHDLSEYFITYNMVDSVAPFVRTMLERTPAVVSYAPGAKQCLRIGGMVEGDSYLDFPTPAHGLAARDASGNLTGFVQPGPSGAVPIADYSGPAAPVLSGTASNGNATLSWAMPPEAREWELFYARERYAGPHTSENDAAQGASPITINELDFDGDYTVTGLTPGYWYAFAVRAYGRNFAAPPSPLSNQVWLLISSGVDSNGDGCPDDWHSAHNLPNAAGNPDKDGLTNAQECKIGTDPRNPDTDGDLVVDGGEVKAGTDPLDPASFPRPAPAEREAGTRLPQLGLSALELSFVAFTQGGNPASQTVRVTNLGDGTLTPSVRSSQAWLKPTVVGGNVVVAIDKSGLGRGHYTGSVTVSAAPANTLGAPQSIAVDLWVLAGNPVSTGDVRPLYLPKLQKEASATGPRPLTLFGDSLAAGWENWSWDTTVGFASTVQVHGGSRAIAITHRAPNAGFSVRAPNPVSTAGYTALRFWVFGNGRQLAFYLQRTDDGGETPFYRFTPRANQWTQVTVPLSAVGSPASFKRINIQDDTGAAQPVYYLDDLMLVGGTEASAVPEPAAAPADLWLPVVQ